MYSRLTPATNVLITGTLRHNRVGCGECYRRRCAKKAQHVCGGGGEGRGRSQRLCEHLRLRQQFIHCSQTDESLQNSTTLDLCYRKIDAAGLSPAIHPTHHLSGAIASIYSAPRQACAVTETDAPLPECCFCAIMFSTPCANSAMLVVDGAIRSVHTKAGDRLHHWQLDHGRLKEICNSRLDIDYTKSISPLSHPRCCRRAWGRWRRRVGQGKRRRGGYREADCDARLRGIRGIRRRASGEQATPACCAHASTKDV